jgi:hypothetical protein
VRRFAVLAVLASLLVAGCGQLPGSTVPESTVPTPTRSTAEGSIAPASTAPGSTSTQTQPGAAHPQPSADAELQAFLAAIAGHAPTAPDALVASVEAAGFPRSAIERTREVDSLGAPVTFLEIAVLTGDGCIIGQVGDGEPIAVRTTALGGGRCLVGDIVTVD